MLAGVVVGIGWLAMRCRSRAAAGALLSPVGLVAGAAAGLVVVAASANFLGGVYFGAGREHALRGAWLPAAAYYEQAVRFAPWEDSYWQSLGEAHAAALARDARDPAARARLGRSRDALETAVWLNAAGAASRRTLAGLYAQAPAGLGPDALGRAEQLYGETLALRPRSAAVLAERAELALRRGSAGDAARLADAAIALDPSRWLAWAVRARAARALGRADEAGGFEEAALARVPREARPRLERYLKGPLPPSPEEAPGARK
jgi:tetratricopeptide (TPR) repeat protein